MSEADQNQVLRQQEQRTIEVRSDAVGYVSRDEWEAFRNHEDATRDKEYEFVNAYIRKKKAKAGRALSRQLTHEELKKTVNAKEKTLSGEHSPLKVDDIDHPDGKFTSKRKAKLNESRDLSKRYYQAKAGGNVKSIPKAGTYTGDILNSISQLGAHSSLKEKLIAEDQEVNTAYQQLRSWVDGSTITDEDVSLVISSGPILKVDARGNITSGSRNAFLMHLKIYANFGVTMRNRAIETQRANMEFFSPEYFTRHYIGTHFHETLQRIERLKEFRKDLFSRSVSPASNEESRALRKLEIAAVRNVNAVLKHYNADPDIFLKYSDDIDDDALRKNGFVPPEKERGESDKKYNARVEKARKGFLSPDAKKGDEEEVSKLLEEDSEVRRLLGTRKFYEGNIEDKNTPAVKEIHTYRVDLTINAIAETAVPGTFNAVYKEDERISAVLSDGRLNTGLKKNLERQRKYIATIKRNIEAAEAFKKYSRLCLNTEDLLNAETNLRILEYELLVARDRQEELLNLLSDQRDMNALEDELDSLEQREQTDEVKGKAVGVRKKLEKYLELRKALDRGENRIDKTRIEEALAGLDERYEGSGIPAADLAEVKHIKELSVRYEMGKEKNIPTEYVERTRSSGPTKGIDNRALAILMRPVNVSRFGKPISDEDRENLRLNIEEARGIELNTISGRKPFLDRVGQELMNSILSFPVLEDPDRIRSMGTDAIHFIPLFHNMLNVYTEHKKYYLKNADRKTRIALFLSLEATDYFNIGTSAVSFALFGKGQGLVNIGASSMYQSVAEQEKGKPYSEVLRKNARNASFGPQMANAYKSVEMTFAAGGQNTDDPAVEQQILTMANAMPATPVKALLPAEQFLFLKYYPDKKKTDPATDAELKAMTRHYIEEFLANKDDEGYLNKMSALIDEFERENPGNVVNNMDLVDDLQ